MTKRIKTFSLLVAAFLVLSIALSVAVGAAEEEETFAKNMALKVETLKSLGEIKIMYVELGDVGKNANTYIYDYEKKINYLGEKELSYESTTNDINLYYTQGVTAGHLAFIYYSYFDDARLDETDKVFITETHDSLQAQIYAAKTSEEISSVSEELYSNQGIYAQMHVKIYEKLLDALLIESDSDAVRQKVTDAKKDIKLCKVVKTDEQ